MATALLKSSLYLLSGLMIMPGALLAYYFWTLIGAIHQKNLIALLLFLLDRIVQTIQWGYWLIIPALAIWIALAFFPKYRVSGALPMALIAAASIIEFFAATGPPKSLGELFFPILSLTGLLLNLWLVWDDLTPTRH